MTKYLSIPGESTIKVLIHLNVQQSSICNQWVDASIKSVYENLQDQIAYDDTSQTVFVKQQQLCQTQKIVIYQMLKSQSETRRVWATWKKKTSLEDTESKEDSEMAESDMETDEDTHKRKHDQKKKHKPSPWDRLIERAYDSV